MAPTIRKPWRAHPELDGLSDAECRGLVERKWRRDPPRLWAIPTLGAVAGVLWLSTVGVLVGRSPITEDESLDQAAAWMVICVIGIGGGVAAAMLAGWLVRWIMVRATLRRIIAGATCPRCAHSLIGLPIHDDATRPEDRSRMRVRCPECGKVVRLIRYGYSPADFAPWSERVLPKDFEVRVKR